MPDEDEEERALREWLATTGAGSDLAYEPDASPAQSAQSDAFSDYIASTDRIDSPQRYAYEAPPEASPRDDSWLWIAGGLDLLLNRGENVGGYISQLAKPDRTAYENWGRRNLAANDAASRERALRPPPQLDPRMADYRDRALKARLGSLDVSRDAEDRKAKAYADENTPDSARAKATRDYLVAQGWNEDELANLSDRQQRKILEHTQRNQVELEMGGDMNALAARRARQVATATIDPKVEVARRTAEETAPIKAEVMREGAEVRDIEREKQAAVQEELAIAGERRKRMPQQEKLRTTLQNLRAELLKRDPNERSPDRGFFLGRWATKIKSAIEGGTGLEEDDSLLNLGQTMAGLQTYVSEANNAPNADPERAIAEQRFRGDGTYGAALRAVDQLLSDVDRTEQRLQEREESSRTFKRAHKRSAPSAQGIPEQVTDADLDEF